MHYARWLVITTLVITTGSAVAEEPDVVVPNAAAAVEGNSNNSFPFLCRSHASSLRYQQVYLGSEIGRMAIGAIAFRQDGSSLPFGPATVIDISISLSSTAAGPDELSVRLDDNVGADTTLVFAGDLEFAGTGGPGPRPFELFIPLDEDFFFDPAGGMNLLLDMIVPDCDNAVPPLDAVLDETDSVSRAFSPPGGTWRDPVGLVASNGDVTGFYRSDDFIFSDGFETRLVR